MTLRTITPWLLAGITLVAGCSKDYPDQPLPNRTPKTYLWLFPDSTIAQGNSRQRIRWWGDDPDGIIKGYLFTAGKVVRQGGGYLDSLAWIWTTRNDSLVAFP